MLSKTQNDLITQTAPGTPGGRFLRSYWQPIATAEEMPTGGAPMPVRVMSEDLVLFRDDKDRLGLIGQLEETGEAPFLMRDPGDTRFADFICTATYIEDDEDGPSYCRRVLGAKVAAS